MKKKRKQSFTKKSKNNSNKNSANNKIEKTTSQQPICIKEQESVNTESSNLTVEIHKPIVKLKTCLLKRDSMVLNDCLKPQWMQFQQSDFKQIKQYY
jgi:hypothetical protein